MERIARPDKFDIPPNDPQAHKKWKLWLRGFKYFLTTIESHNPNKLELLFLHIGPEVVDVIQDCQTYDDAVKQLDAAYLKTPNEIYARHLLSTRHQKPEETIDEFLLALNNLAGDCNFVAVTANEHRAAFVRDSFIRGLRSSSTRTRLLENATLTLEQAVQQARSLEQAQRNAESYASPAVWADPNAVSAASPAGDTSVAAASQPPCFFCGLKRHPRVACPARNSVCGKCGKSGHWRKVCRSKSEVANVSAVQQEYESSPEEPRQREFSPTLAASLSAMATHAPATVYVKVNGHQVKALIDTGSSDNFISAKLVSTLGTKVLPRSSKVSMASSSLSSHVRGYCVSTVTVDDREYREVDLSILPDLCTDVILGMPFLRRHEGITLELGGDEPELNICNLAQMKVSQAASPKLFSNLTADCHPIATRARQFSHVDEKFIENEIHRLLGEGVIEPSRSPWRAQVVVTHTENKKKRMVVDFSQTINRFTQLDAYPLPNISDLVNKVGKNSFFSVLDLSSAYYQIEIDASERPYTAFQAAGKLYQFRRIPMGVTNGAAAFQRVMNDIIAANNLKETYAYLDDLTICGRTREEHDENLRRFWEVADALHLTLNRSKCKIGLDTVNILGYSIQRGQLRPDPERLRPLQELPEPRDKKSLQRLIGLFAYYARWVPSYSEKIRPLVSSVSSFPLSPECRAAIKQLKTDISRAVVAVIRDDVPFTVETDASDEAIAATLTQDGRPVAFFSRTLNEAEKRHSIIEKEAYAIVESIRKWRHFLTKHFNLLTDQRSVSFMFDNKVANKIKNEKILRWRIELSPLSYTVKYRPGRDNIPADALSRAHCAAASYPALEQLHEALIHPGVTRMLHFVRSKNLPYSVDDVRRVTSSCPVCCRCKPNFYRAPSAKLVKATSAFERINVDFKGPLPLSPNGNQYILTMIDEFSRFPFAYPWDMTTTTVIRCLTHLFSIFGMPAYVHSDRGSAFMSVELRSFLTGLGIATSRTTPYHPQGNSQCERLNGTIWRAVQLSMESKKLSRGLWDTVLPDVLHSIRSLLCTATNATPHERMFSFQRRSATGTSLPSWLVNPGKVLLKKYVRGKADLPVEPVELLEANPYYAYVRHPTGKVDTVSVRDLAPCGTSGDDVTTDPEELQGVASGEKEGTSEWESPGVPPRSDPSDPPSTNTPSPSLPSSTPQPSAPTAGSPRCPEESLRAPSPSVPRRSEPSSAPPQTASEPVTVPRRSSRKCKPVVRLNL